MRAARLLQILLILQNRGRQTSRQLAAELEVTPRTILRDVDAMTEAGLPIIVHQGNMGGIELGFHYRTWLTGLAQDEAEAMGLILSAQNPLIAAVGLDHAATRARAKLIESFPDQTRYLVTGAIKRFENVERAQEFDPRTRALAMAIRARTIVRLRFATDEEAVIHPVAMKTDGVDWWVEDAISGQWIGADEWGRLNISAKIFRLPERKSTP